MKMKRRRWSATGAAVALVLVASLTQAFPAAGAEVGGPFAPVPVGDTPVPGDPLPEAESAPPGASSEDAALPPAVVIDAVAPRAIELPATDVEKVATQDEDGGIAATTGGDWQLIGDSGIAVSSALAGEGQSPAERQQTSPELQPEPSPEPSPETTPTGDPDPDGSPSPVTSPEPLPTATSLSSAAPTPEASPAPEPSPTSSSTATPEPGKTPKPGKSPKPEKTAKPEKTPEPTSSPAVEPTPAETGNAVDEAVISTVEAGVRASDDEMADAFGDAVAVTLARADGGTEDAPVAVKVPEPLLDGLFGADYASRVQWIQVPLADDGSPVAEAALPVASIATADALILSPMVADTPVMLTAVAGATAANGTGSYAATPLKSSSSWDVAEQTGAFTWTYAMTTPSAAAGPSPTVALSYNSQSVDGLTGSTNNQPSAIGEGWDLSAGGFIERSYVPCSKDDGASGAVKTSGDLCWRTDNATVSFAGHSGALIKDQASGVWKLQSDDGTRFEKLTGASQGCAANGTSSTECWRMTTTDGTKYYFGLNQLPGWVSGNAKTNSVWTVPVFGNDAGEPCHQSTFASSSCMQAWRWNLDYIVDVHGNAEALYYTAETNKYAKNGSGATAYQRGGVLSRIDYGLRSSNIYGATAAGYKVLFTYDARGRCSDSTGAKCTTGTLSSATMPANPSAYPDVPFDQLCTGTTCSASQIVPTFFTNASLVQVQSQVLASGAYKTVDSWALSHSFPAPGDGTSPALWLTKVQRTGTAAGQAAITEPATVFSGTTMQNRVWTVDGLAPLDKWRLSSIKTSLGAVIGVNYQGQQCTPAEAPAIMAAPETNTKWCFPEFWVPQTTPPVAGRTDLFHKYPVTSISVDARTGGALSKVQTTQYFYGTPRWRYNDSPLIVGNQRTWNLFAGVNTVEVREGDPAVPAAQKVSKYTYYQGMNGDRASASGGTKAITVTGTTIPDERWFAGQVYRQQTLNGVGGTVIADTVNTPWASGVKSNDGSRQARMTNVQRTVTTEPVSAGGTRSVTTSTTFDTTYGYPLTVSSSPSDAIATCTTTTYAAPNTSAWVIGLPSEVSSVAKACDQLAGAAFPRDHISDVKTTYDGAAWGAAATRGLPTSTQAIDSYSGSTPHWAVTGSTTYDALGRPLVSTDALGRTTTNAYSPAAALPVVSSTVKNTAPFSWTTTTKYDVSTGQPISVVDQNGALTTIAIDALGRTSKVWLPLNKQSVNPSAPSLAFTYTLSQTAPNAIKSSIRNAGGVSTTFQLFDGLGRATQTQSPASGGGAVVNTTSYDAQGRAYFVDNDYWASTLTPGTAFFTPVSENNIPSQVVTSYDAVGRVTKTVLNSLGSAKQTTTMAYLGVDRVDTIPPTGGTVTSEFTNSVGKKTKLVQYLTSTVTGTGQATTYVYDGAGRMTQMKDPAGAVWKWGYDPLGRRISQSDPDSGASSATYDLVGNMTSTKDARGKVVTTTYDALNRKTAMYAGTSSGAKLAAWTYDTVKKGLVTSSTSYTGSVAGTPGKAYTTTVGSYDDAGNVLQSTLSIPTGAPAFGGTSYTTTMTYNVDSQLESKSVPSMGGLPAEIIRFGYDSWGRLSNSDGYTQVLAGTQYTPIGRLSQLTRFDGLNNGYSTYSYNEATGAVLGIEDTAVYNNTGHTPAHRTYTRDAIGNVLSQTISSNIPNSGTQKTCYVYDRLRQLTRAWTPNSASTCQTAPSASAMGGVAPMWNDYTYNSLNGNRTGMTYHSATGAASTVSYAYPTATSARPHAVTTVAGPTDLGAGAYGYDAAGNMTSAPGQTISFDDVGKVVKVVAGSVTVSNIYDASGNLLLRTSSGSEGSSLYVGDTVLTQAKGSTVVAGFRTYVGPEGKPVAQRSAKTGTAGTVFTWLFSNHDGTVDTQTVAKTGATTRSYRDPFGVPIGGSTGVWANGNGFLNKPVMGSTKLTTIGARTYAAVIGKFISVDPITDARRPQQNTGYAYSGNNPVTFSDPTGLILDEGCGGGMSSAVLARARHLHPSELVGYCPRRTRTATGVVPETGVAA